MLSVRNLLIYIAIHYKGDWERIRQAISDKERFSEEEVMEEVNKLKCNTLTILDENYPDCLKHIFKPPFVLFYYGDISLIYSIKKNVSVIGSRNCSGYGVYMTEKIISELPKDMIIVSGLARGIDGIAHRSALENSLNTVAVLGSGIDYCYPKENEDLYEVIKNNGLLISEYPNNQTPSIVSLPLRNRLISAFSSGVLVTEAHQRSGTLITVGFALQSGKEVMCVPYRSTDDTHCNRLISEGATLVESGNDIVDILNLRI